MKGKNKNEFKCERCAAEHGLPLASQLILNNWVRVKLATSYT